jgi:GTP-binding protein
VLADIPGLIEGASEGVGLGHDFLRHIERTRVLIHVIDLSGLQGREPVDDYIKLNAELSAYSPSLASRPQLVALNKLDLQEARTNLPSVREQLRERGVELFEVSAATGEGTRELMEAAYEVLKSAEPPSEETKSPVGLPERSAGDVAELTEEDVEHVFRAQAEQPFHITFEEGTYVVRGETVERWVAMTDFANEESVEYLQHRLENLGVEQRLREYGAQDGDTVRIGEQEFELEPFSEGA